MGAAAERKIVGEIALEADASGALEGTLPKALSAPLPPEIDSRIPLTAQSYSTREQAAQSDIALGRMILNVSGAHTPMAVLDLDIVTQQDKLWNEHLPNVSKHYAVKCNDTPALLIHMNSLGMSFDAATAGELYLLKNLGISPEKIICTHPSRRDEDIEAIRECRPRAVVVDSPEEVRKLKTALSSDYMPEIFIRISLSKEGLSGAFGVPVLRETLDAEGKSHEGVDVTGVRRIVAEIQAVEREMNMSFSSINISTHVGTNTCVTEPYEKVFKTVPIIQEALGVERSIKLDSGDTTVSPVTIKTLNLGGGYCDTLEPIKHGTTQEQFFKALGEKVAEFHTQHPELLLIAEPGRSMVANAGTLFMSVTSVLREYREEQIDGKAIRIPDYRIRLDDGLYGSLMGQIHDGQLFQFVAFSPDGTPRSTKTVPFTLKGATCDSFDTIEWRRALPEDIQPGDILVVRYAGAYTAATATKFNAIDPPQKTVLNRTENGLKISVHDWSGKLIGTHEGEVPNSPTTLGRSAEEMVKTLTKRFGATQECAYSIAGLLSGPLNTLAPEHTERIYNKKLERAITSVFNNELTLQLSGLRAIAVGGMGVVFEGVDKLGRKVALKVGLDEAGSELADRFKEEAKLTAELAAKDKRIPSIINAGILPEGELPFYTMELIKGKTLSATIEGVHSLSGDKIDWRKNPGARLLLNNISEAALALSSAHEHGIIHRDVKPENLMVPEGIKVPIKVIDWGLFKGELAEDSLRETLDQPGLTEAGLGTIDYMSPEQARGEEVTAATDVWALGATLYKAVYNQVPLESWGSALSRLQALRAADSDLISCPETIPEELRSIILKALQVKAEDRYETAALMAEDLKAFLENKPVAAHSEEMNVVNRVAYSTKLLVERERKKVLATTAAITLTGAGLFTWNKIETEQQREHEAALIAKSDLEALKKSAEKAFSDAKELSQNNRLDEARAQLSDNLIRDLGKHPELKELHADVVRYREAWDTLSKFEAEIFKVYSSLVNSFDFGTTKTIDVAAMREASKIYLPDGLTEDGIKKLREMLDASPLTKEQRLKIGDGLIEWACLQAGEDFPDVLVHGYTDQEAQDQCELVLDRVSIIEELAATCAGISEGEIHGWVPAIEFLKRRVFSSLRDEQGRSSTFRRASLSFSTRGSAQFLIGVFGQWAASSPEDTIESGLINFQATIALMPKHLAANVMLSNTMYLDLPNAANELDYRNRLNSIVGILRNCSELDPNNPAHWGRLALACQQSWSKERVHDQDKRVNRIAHSQGYLAGHRCILLSSQNGLEVPNSILAAFGELAYVSSRTEEAYSALSKVLERDPTNLRAKVIGLCCEIELNPGGIKSEYALDVLAESRASPEISPELLPEIAAVYAALAQRAAERGENAKVQGLVSAAVDCLKYAIEEVPDYAGLIRRRRTSWYSWLANRQEATDFFSK